jgi:hypothetical protein
MTSHRERPACRRLIARLGLRLTPEGHVLDRDGRHVSASQGMKQQLQKQAYEAAQHQRLLASLDPAMAACRALDDRLQLLASCQTALCPTTSVVVKVKDTDRTLGPYLAQRGLRCPLCGVPLQLRNVGPQVEAATEHAS